MIHTKLILLAIVAVLAKAQEIELDQYEIESRIIQGQNAARGQFPYYVFLEVQLPQGNGACGGSLISDQWVVTAGHCIKNAKGARVHLGSLKAKDFEEVGRVMINVTAEAFHVHPKYFQLFVLNDIGLIKLPSPVKFTDIIKSVPMACSSTSGMDVIATGNGLTKDTDKTIAPTLQYTQLQTITMAECVLDVPIILFRKSVICARGVQQRSVCRGDSGGPLVTSDTDALVGISSFVNILGCEAGNPQGFTRVSAHLEWIKEVTGISCKK